MVQVYLEGQTLRKQLHKSYKFLVGGPMRILYRESLSSQGSEGRLLGGHGVELSCEG